MAVVVVVPIVVAAVVTAVMMVVAFGADILVFLRFDSPQQQTVCEIKLQIIPLSFSTCRCCDSGCCFCCCCCCCCSGEFFDVDVENCFFDGADSSDNNDTGDNNIDEDVHVALLGDRFFLSRFSGFKSTKSTSLFSRSVST